MNQHIKKGIFSALLSGFIIAGLFAAADYSDGLPFSPNDFFKRFLLQMPLGLLTYYYSKREAKQHA